VRTEIKRVSSLTALATVAALLAGCGGSSGGSSNSSGGSSNSSSSGQLSAVAWKAKINGICATMAGKSNALPKPTKTAELKPYIQKIVNLAHSEIAEINGVAAPSQFAAGQKAVISDLDTVFAGLQSLLSKPITATTFATSLRSPAVLHAAQDYVARSKAAGLPSCVLANGE
jgi:hypothetical protein